MKLAKVARNVVLAGIAWKFIARRRALARQQRRRRMVVVPVLIAGAAVGAIWVAKRRLGLGTRRALEIDAVEVEVEVDPIGGDGRRATSSARPSLT